MAYKGWVAEVAVFSAKMIFYIHDMRLREKA